MKELVFFLEEPSAKEALNGVLPRLLDQKASCRCICFEGKQDLEKQLGKRLRGWLKPDTLFVVLRDQDSADCVQVKKKLVEICRSAGKPDALVRIVCHELESWFLGDLQAIEVAFSINKLSTKQDKRKFRDPDRLRNPKQELRKLTHNRYQQILGARKIGVQLSLTSNRSTSFLAFISGVQRLLEKEAAL